METILITRGTALLQAPVGDGRSHRRHNIQNPFILDCRTLQATLVPVIFTGTTGLVDILLIVGGL